MHISKKFLIIGGLCVVIIAATIGGVAAVNAAENGATRQSEALTTLIDKVADIYEQNTGTAIDPAELQKAFEQAGASLKTDRLNTYLQKLVDKGKISQERADQWKAWWDSRPGTILSDEFKTWMESRPDIPGTPGLWVGMGRMMPFRSMIRGDMPCLGN